ncbi:polysaccharide deacetylase [Sphingomonas sp. Leaf412]|uniref:polysaccharide deacetylase family protein n=1 Tax=Sphingomonas sp. Leaf412 TaxID=1736370 RepID=UPI0006F7EDD8|nr:polysaccharide deacetylase family protein [Sphingomonas sp. Leaf412]KQT33539.1 polysaccharide deacetylase [Sphingomonas sp. Leaf412]
MAAVFLTIDTEFAWRHHAAGHDAATIHARSVEPAGVGLTAQLAMLARYGLKATFFVDPMPALVHGDEWIARMVAPVLAAGQEVQLHCHANWLGADAVDRTRHGRFELTDHDAGAQRAMLARAIDLLTAAGAPRPVAFRSGSYAANDDTLRALASLGIAYDSSHNGNHAPWPSAIALPPERIAPVRRHGVVEVPVTQVEDRRGRWRNAQVCALSAAEMRAALDHAVAHDHATVTIVGHSFELANRAGTAPNKMHVRRFEALCETLAARRGGLPTTHFADRPVLPLDRDDRPLARNAVRRGWRQVEQAWSTLVAERAA